MAGIRTEMQALVHYVSSGRKEGRVYKTPTAKKEDFDWMAYLESNPDIYYLGGLKEQVPAIMHFNTNGMGEGRPYTRILPDSNSWDLAVAKLKTYRSSLKTLRRQNLIVYNIEDIGSSDVATDITFNNIKSFVTALLHHSEDESAHTAHTGTQKAFYLFNVAARTDNPALPLLPLHLPNVAVVHWTYASCSMNTFLRTLHLLGAPLTETLDAVFHLNR
jgi:hypothetical protein